MKVLANRADRMVLTAASSYIKEELERRGKTPLFLTISGSHSHGLERPDSDVDVRGIYLDSLEQVLSLHRGKDTVEGSQGDIDYQCYELGKFLSMLLKSNGNMVRLVLSPLTTYAHPGIGWEELGRKFTTKALRLYYRGYAESQRKRAMSCRGGKALIYTYREMFEGLAVMDTGKPIWDFVELWAWVKNQGYYTGDLLDRHFGHPEKEITDEGWHQFYTEWEYLCDVLDIRTSASKLPERYDGYEELNSMLLAWRQNNSRDKIRRTK